MHRAKTKTRTRQDPRLRRPSRGELGRRGLRDDLSGLHEGRDGDRGKQNEGGCEAVNLGHGRISLELLYLRCRSRSVWMRRGEFFS